MEAEITNMNDLMADIRKVTAKQKAASKVDEIRVMKTMLNDPEFKVAIYDRNKGLIGTRSPREEAVKFIASTAVGITGIDPKAAEDLANKYEFTKKDASFLIDNVRDFTATYVSTGRKFPIIQSPDAEAAVFSKPIASKEKVTPSGRVSVPAYNKIICRSKSPKYNTSK